MKLPYWIYKVDSRLEGWRGWRYHYVEVRLRGFGPCDQCGARTHILYGSDAFGLPAQYR